MPRYRVTEMDNPSVEFEDDFDDAFVTGGAWIFARFNSEARVGAAPTYGPWPTKNYRVEREEHGGTWVKLDPDEYRHPSEAGH